ncbi:SDR family NAD(P)-dependent oxidoreductase [Chryseolinea sp. H1M3-3]|uniref:SDR family NAD(P)-dependent oxidoreductase n=1 Tax=Chryseolinea sp. H1M3-3 TaxID=3034144 RepID=UPI0023EABBF8|nr:SDR family NAD(P)-dependent oxidoreductase [Chryseolinea sp. H1M3-3]
MLHGNTILITGGGSGIGEALAINLSKENKVVICGRNEDKLKRVSAKSDNIDYEVSDLSNPESIVKLFATLKTKHILLDVLINNAGVVEIWNLSKQQLTPYEIFEKISTNLSGAIALTQEFIHQADHAKENLIINNTSEIVIMPVPILPLYSASKTGLSVFTKCLRIQLKKTKFKVIEILPPAVDTDMPKQINNPGALVNTDAFASDVIKNIRRGGTEYAPGANIVLLKLFKSLFPSAVIILMDRLSKKLLTNS